MRPVFLVALFAGVIFAGDMEVWSAQDVKTQLTQLQQERRKLATIRQDLENRLGHLGNDLKNLDKQIVAAAKESSAAEKSVKIASKKLDTLQLEHRVMESNISELREHILNEVSVAYQQLERTHWFVFALRGISVTEIPHRQYLLSRLLESQAEDRERYVQGLHDLQRLELETRRQLTELEQLRHVKLARQKDLAERQSEKRTRWEKVQKDVNLKRKREKAIVLQENALKRLLEQLKSGLSANDANIHRRPIRTRKGKLGWPIKSRVTVGFGQRPEPGKARIAGVQLKPLGKNRQVKTLASGQVRYADWFGGYGLMMIIDHGDGMISVYAHNDALYKQNGDWVEDGEVVARAGSTGWVERTLLYFELRDTGKPVNPRKWCRKR
ncbi:MAG: murein hydrolase activator EnvC family protein [Mariprofundaceae bacterium]